MRKRNLLWTVVLLTTVAAPAFTSQQGRAPQCLPASSITQMPELPEASGIAASRKAPGRFWVHNDSGEPVLMALDDHGAVTGRVRLTGVTVEDVEAVAVGPCPGGSCLYIGDIGDNDGTRSTITVYRIPEPDGLSDRPAPAEAFRATYPDGAHDAEALLVTGNGDLFIVTKGHRGPVSVYQFPRDMRPGSTVSLTRVGQPRDDGNADDEMRVTDGAASPDGEWIVLRSNSALHIYLASEVTSGTWRNERRVDLTALREPQGEGVTFADDSTLVLVGEGGSGSRAGTFVRLTCMF